MRQNFQRSNCHRVKPSNLYHVLFSVAILVATNHGAKAARTVQQEKEEEGKERQEIGKERRWKEKEEVTE